MARNIEHIVACHQAAAALREAGKPIWNKRVDIKAILFEDQGNTTPEHIADISGRIAQLMRASLPSSYFDLGHEDCDFDFLDAIEAMEECTVKSLGYDLENGVEPVEMFNGWLETIYDWADNKRIWIGS